MQSLENQVYELQNEVREKEQLIRELNNTILEQRDYLDSKYTHDNSQSMNSFDSKSDGSAILKRKRKYKDPSAKQSEEDAETIEGLKEDIKQLLKEYKLMEKQKEDVDVKYDDLLQKNEELARELVNMEQVIEDQDTQIMNMREKLQSQMKEMKHIEVYHKQINMMNNHLGSALDVTDTDLNKSANISQQINLENFKAGRIGGREPKDGKRKIDKKALKDVLNLSYQLINPEGDRREQSFIEERISMRKARGMSPFGLTRDVSPLVMRNKEAKNTDSTTAEGDSKESKQKLASLNRLYSASKFTSK
jgi:chromosome segregation ATPase